MTIQLIGTAVELHRQLQVYGNRGVIDALRFVDTYNFDRGNGRFTVRNDRVDVGYHNSELCVSA